MKPAETVRAHLASAVHYEFVAPPYEEVARKWRAPMICSTILSSFGLREPAPVLG
jgi:hypothetical protein